MCTSVVYVSFASVCFWATVTSSSSPYAIGPLSSCPVCNVGVLWPNMWMDQDGTWYGGRPRPGRHWVRWGPSSSPYGRGHSRLPHFSEGAQHPLPTFRPVSIVAKRSPISATAELLFYSIVCAFYFVITLYNTLHRLLYF